MNRMKNCAFPYTRNFEIGFSHFPTHLTLSCDCLLSTPTYFYFLCPYTSLLNSKKLVKERKKYANEAVSYRY